MGCGQTACLGLSLSVSFTMQVGSGGSGRDLPVVIVFHFGEMWLEISPRGLRNGYQLPKNLANKQYRTREIPVMRPNWLQYLLYFVFSFYVLSGA